MVKITICWGGELKSSEANIIKSFVIDLVGDIGMFKQRVHTQDAVIRFDNSGGDLRASPDSETNLRLFTIIDGKSFQHQASQTRSGTSSDSVEDDKSLESSTIVSQLTDSVKNKVDNFFPNCIMA